MKAMGYSETLLMTYQTTNRHTSEHGTVNRRQSGVTGGGGTIRISKATASPKRQKTRTEMNGKFNDISSADENT
jgi:transcriptional regulator CtsR